MSGRIQTPVTGQQFAHRSVRKYLDAPVSDAQLETIVAAAQHASTSSNQQVWTVIAIRDEDRKRRISEAIGGRDYVENAAVFLVWVADFARNEAVMRTHGVEPESLDLMEVTLLGALDVGIAAQNALLAAESLGLGGVFVGSIRNNPAVVCAELGLPPRTFPIVGMAIGVPDPDEGTGIKPRLPLDGVLHQEEYDSERWRTATAEYEDSYRDYFADQGVPGRSWARTVAGRLGPVSGLHGRHTMRDSLRAQGLPSE